MAITLPSKLAALLCVIPLLSACSTLQAKKESTPANSSALAAKAEGKQCVDNFDLLRKLNYDAFNLYKTQFDEINRNYDYYKNNQLLMENDPKELITFTLNDKLNMICERVKSQTFVEIRKKMQAVSKI
ncbi:hypothetical protein AB4K05_06330 [Kluyvera sp. STS39-E]|uniref:hypothetical protein n=1 Tax=Kluyvera sp. STS39-E TaxID=3234748 RepID=UPI0034C632D3